MPSYQIHNKTFEDCRLLVIGDSMIDRYYHGNITRMSPEADVPVVDIYQTEDSLGGAANVALNIVTLGGQAALVSLAGLDTESELLKTMLHNSGIKNSIISDNRPTTIKARVYNDKQYVIRLDKESTDDISISKSDLLLKTIEDKIQLFHPDVCILQDYNKGLFTAYNIPLIINLLQKHSIPIAVDPKKKHFFDFKNVDLFKPNTKEVVDALNISFDKENVLELNQIFDKLHKKLNFNNLLLTLSEKGVYVSNGKQNYSYPAVKRNVVDVSGAGDTVIAVAALLMAKGFDIGEMAKLANLAGGIVIEQKGVKPLQIDTFIQQINQHLS
jgi:D-glycero-beta-D-manno-heptose-7-phosphate kinase